MTLTSMKIWFMVTTKPVPKGSYLLVSGQDWTMEREILSQPEFSRDLAAITLTFDHETWFKVTVHPLYLIYHGSLSTFTNPGGVKERYHKYLHTCRGYDLGKLCENQLVWRIFHSFMSLINMISLINGFIFHTTEVFYVLIISIHDQLKLELKWEHRYKYAI